MTGKGKPKKSEIETNILTVKSKDANISVEEYEKLPKNPIYIILDNLRSAFNVGSIFRLCDSMRVAGLFLCGYTASPPHIKLEKTAAGTIPYVPWKKFETTLDAVSYLHKKNIEVWAVETTSQSSDYSRVDFYPSPIGLVLGNEALGVTKEVLLACDKIVEIPLYGFKNSINVAVACGIVGFRILEHFSQRRSSSPLLPYF
ncbi:MAG: RNA methyltransferase [Chitinispirillaceae bacterium]|nr:RNA methyltransferase [Chitinispirillaceae bacterium]